ncbi:hypothetical protein [Vulcanisaeta distributa]|uniref:hypothetical protein n=1 Tax=Vulcanisaeta distributa TaxID=164451 RepID=UPI0006D1675A|nr:hypothetical protein [Vulcanisaeta distributa]
MEARLDPEEEYVVMPLSILERILRYAMVVCQEHCPAGRDPATCPYLVNLTRQVGLSPPPCINDYGEYRPETFRVMIRDLEHKYGMSIEDFVNMVRRRKPRSLEEQTDFMEATFYLGVLKELSNMKSIYIAKGSDISVRKAVVVR